MYEPDSTRGRKSEDLLGRLVIKYVTGPKNKPSWVCISGCGYESQGYAGNDRVLKHVTQCMMLANVNPDLYREALQASGIGSLGSRLGLDGVVCSMPSANSSLTTPATSSSVVPAVSVSSKTRGSGAMSKKSKKSAASQSNTLNVGDLRNAGLKAKEEAREKFQDKVDHCIMRLICTRGLVPNVIDSPEWNELMGLLNPQYHPTSATSFADKHIPREAVFVREQQLQYLRQESNLTLTFDGTTIRKPSSIYTVHATDSERRTFFLDGHIGGDVRQNADWIETRISAVCFVANSHTHKSLM